MINYRIEALILAAGLAFASTARAETMSKAQYKSAEERIESEGKAGKANCASLSGNAKDICVAEAKGNEKVAKAELLAQYEPTAKHGKAARVARADAAYAVSIEKCDDLAGNLKDVCVKEAKAAKVHAIADATVRKETSDANATANKTSAEAGAKAAAIRSEVRQEASAEKLAADYAVAKEKCDVLSGEPKDACVNDAKIRFSQR
jgi:hypothetical protein